MVVAIVGLAMTPTGAEAFLEESKVLDPVTKALKPAAETVLKQPGFLPETVVKAGAVGGGAAAASEAAAVFQAGAVLPVLGSVVAFGVGSLVGSEICLVIGIKGCWYFGSEAADPAKPPVVTWAYVTTGPTFNGHTGPSFAWYAHQGGSPAATIWKGVGGAPTEGSCALAQPSGVSTFFLLGHDGAKCSGSSVERAYAIRYSMANRTLEYHATDNPEIGNYSYTAPGDWATKMGKALTSGSPEADHVGEHIASKIAGSEIKSPYETYVEIPDCDGLIYATCADLLEELGLEPAREDLNWSDVETTTPNEVRELEPAKSKEVEVGTGVKVITNPPEEGMPIVVPEPEDGETYSHYAARLNPGLTPERHDLEAAFVDPTVGPNGVVEVSPEPATKLDPSTTHKVDVTTNPADAPLVPAAWSPPDLASIDLDPISGIPSPCTAFPFGLFCWLGEALGQFNTSGTCPQFSAPVAGTGSDFEVTMCGDTADTIMGYLRPALLLAFIVGCGFLFARGTKAVGAD